MSQGSYTKVLSIAGTEFRVAQTITTSGEYERVHQVPAAKAGTLTARTDNDTGTATMSGGHGLTTGRMDVYWTEGGAQKCRYGMTGTVTVNAVALDGGAGDPLPVTTTALMVAAPVLYDFAVKAAKVQALGLTCAAPAAAVARDAEAASVAALRSNGDGAAFAWSAGDGVDNPLSDDAADAYLSHAGATPQTVYLRALIN